MGQKGTEIVEGNVQEIIGDLTRAYADEWLAHYNYLLAANLATGLQAPIVAERLRKSSEEELGHANRLAERIVQLGGKPVAKLSEIEASSNHPPFAMPDDPRDLKGILEAVLASERAAISVYQSLVDKTRIADVVTHELAEDLLEAEVADEEEAENLLGI